MKEKQKKVSCENENNKIIPNEEIKDEKLKKEIENFKFLCNMAVLKE